MKKDLSERFDNRSYFAVCSATSVSDHCACIARPGLGIFWSELQHRQQQGMCCLHPPFLLGLALAWFWDRFKGLSKRCLDTEGLEMGIMYALIATLAFHVDHLQRHRMFLLK